MEKYNGLCSFDDLTPQLKIANIRQARSIPLKLSIIGCELADMSDERPAIEEFLEDEILDFNLQNSHCNQAERELHLPLLQYFRYEGH